MAGIIIFKKWRLNFTERQLRVILISLAVIKGYERELEKYMIRNNEFELG